MSEKKELVEKARRLGREYLRKYGGCAPATLLAVADTLNLEVCDDLFKAMIGLSSLSGGCGNVCGGIAAMGLRYGVGGREDFVKKPDMRAFEKIMKTAKVLREKFVEEYGGYLCADVTTKLFGKPIIFPTSPEELEAFMKKDPEQLEALYEKCSSVTENAAGWTVAAILEMDEK